MTKLSKIINKHFDDYKLEKDNLKFANKQIKNCKQERKKIFMKNKVYRKQIVKIKQDITDAINNNKTKITINKLKWESKNILKKITLSSNKIKNKFDKLNKKKDKIYKKFIAAKEKYFKSKNRLRRKNRKENKQPQRFNIIGVHINNKKQKNKKINNIIKARKKECKEKYKSFNQFTNKNITKYNTFNQFINSFSCFFNNKINNIQMKVSKYNSQLLIGDVIYSIIKLVSNDNYNISKVTQDLKNHKISFVTKEAINMKRANIPSEYFKELFDSTYEFIQNDPNFKASDNGILKNTDLFGVDGSTLHFVRLFLGTLKNVKKDKYDNFFKLVMNTICNLKTNIPVNSILSEKLSEQQLFKKQLDVLTTGSIILADGHYYSKEILDKLLEKKINAIFRIPKNLKIVKNNLGTSKNDVIVDNKFRLIKYKTNNKIIILGTTLLNNNKYSSALISEIYKMRWFIEEYFKLVKCSLNFKDTKSKHINNILQEMYTHMLIVLISKYIQQIGKKFINTKKSMNNEYKINDSNFIHNIANSFMYKIFYEKMNKKTIQDIKFLLFDILNVIILIEDNRYEIRERKTPITQFNNGKTTNK
jgi:hypothetical protein